MEKTPDLAGGGGGGSEHTQPTPTRCAVCNSLLHFPHPLGSSPPYCPACSATTHEPPSNDELEFARVVSHIWNWPRASETIDPVVEAFAALSTFRLHFREPGWIVRWYFDRSQQYVIGHVRVHRGYMMELRAPADSVVAIVELDAGGFKPYGAVRG